MWTEVMQDREDLCANGSVSPGSVEGPRVEALGPSLSKHREIWRRDIVSILPRHSECQDPALTRPGKEENLLGKEGGPS